MPSIRPALPEDAAALAALDARCNPSAWSAAQFQAALAAPNDTVLIAEENNFLQGLIVWQQILDETELHLIATAPECRRRGIAAALMQRMMQAAVPGGRMFLEVRTGNLPARTLYERLGFAETAVRKSYYADGEDAVLYCRAL